MILYTYFLIKYLFIRYLPTYFVRGIYCAKYYGQGGGGNGAGEKNENEAVGNKMKKKEKGKRKKKKRKRGSMIFFVNIMHTSVDHCILS